MTTRTILRQVTVALMALTGAAALGGCLVMSKNQVSETGTRISEGTLAQVEPGHTSTDWLLAAIGEPTARTPVGEDGMTEIWRYDHVRREDSSGAVFLIFGGTTRRSESRRVFFEVTDGRVQRTWQET